MDPRGGMIEECPPGQVMAAGGIGIDAGNNACATGQLQASLAVARDRIR